MAEGVSPARRIVILIGLLLALVVPLLGLSRLAEHVNGVPPLVGREGVWWALVALILFYVLVIERKKLSSIGLRRPSWKTLAFGVGAVVVTFIAVGGGLQLLMTYFHLSQNQSALGALLGTPLLYRIALVTRAAVAEEILFRGYGIERLQELTGSRVVAGVVTLAVFTYAHLSYWGWVQLLFAGGAGAVLTILYLWRRDLWANILAHWLVDAAGLIFFTPPHH